MDFAGIRALSFDCYGTLIDWETGLADAVSVIHPGASLDRERLLQVFAATESDLERRTPGLRYSAVLELAYGELVSRLGLVPAADGATRFARAIGDWPPFSDTPASLGALQRHFRLVVLSNVDRASFALTHPKLGVRMDAVFTAEEIGSYKPDRRNFEFLLERMREAGVSASQLVHVAQSRYHDIEPASALGLRTVWVDRRHGRPGWGATPPPAGGAEPDLTVQSLAELAARAAGSASRT